MISSQANFFDHLSKLYAPKASKKALGALRRFLGPDRDRLPADYMNEAAYLDAYLRYYLPLHLPEFAWILDQSARFGLKPARGSTVLDLGSGPGTLSLAMSLWAKKQNLTDLDFTLVDRSASALELAKTLHEQLGSKTNLALAKSDLTKTSAFRGSDRFDWILAGHMINEWGSDPRGLGQKQKFFEAVMHHLMHEQSVFVVIEPPLREPTMDLMKLRDFWVRDLGGKVLLPCPGGTERCPALKSRLGWCYSKIPRSWARDNGFAPLDKKVEEFLGQELHYNGFSYLLLAAPEADLNLFNNPSEGRKVAFSDERRKPSLWCRNTRIETSNRRPKHRGQIL